MTILITGGAASGKSALAERLAAATRHGRAAYLATMRVIDAECRARVARHRRMRAGRGFETLELPFGLPKEADLARFDTALLECLSNLTANVMFGRGKSPEETAGRILADVDRLRRTVRVAIIVTNEVFSDGGLYEPSTRAYIRTLGRINCRVAAQADAVVESVCGIPVIRKGREAMRAYEAAF